MCLRISFRSLNVSRELRCQEMKKECRVRRGNNGSNLHYAVIQEGGSFGSGYRRRHCINALNRKQIPIVGFHLQSVSQSVIALRKAQLLQGDWSNTPSQVQSARLPHYDDSFIALASGMLIQQNENAASRDLYPQQNPPSIRSTSRQRMWQTSDRSRCLSGELQQSKLPR